MKPVALIFVLSFLFVSTFGFANEVIEIGDVRLEYSAQSGLIVLSNRHTGVMFAQIAPHAIQVLNWALATATSLKTGLSEKRDPFDKRMGKWLVSGENGKAGVFHLDTRFIFCEPAKVGNVFDVLFARPNGQAPLKIVEGTEQSLKYLQAELVNAGAKGGGFLRVFVKDNALIDASVCTWNAENPANPFDPNAWRQTSTRIGLVRGTLLFKDIFVLDPSRHPDGFQLSKTGIEGEKIDLESWQQQAVLGLEEEARRRGKVIACAPRLSRLDIRADPWVREAFCFVIDASAIPMQGEEDRGPVKETKRVGLRRVKYEKL